MPFFDLRTVIFISIFISCLTGTWMLVSRKVLKSFSGFGYLALAHFSLGLGFLLLALRGFIPDFLSILVGNLLVVLTFVFGFIGITVFRQVPVRGRGLCWFCIFVQITSFSFFTYLQPNLEARLLLADVIFTVLLILCLRALLKDAEKALKLLLFATAAPLFLTLFASIVRFCMTLSGHMPVGLLQGGLVFTLQSIFGDMILLGTALGFTTIAIRKVSLQLEREALTDPLTGVFNRRATEKIAAKILDRAQRNGSSGAVFLLDLDHFKGVNDSFGHAAGDVTLLRFSDLVQNQLRGADVFARHGGEEFVAIVQDCDQNYAYTVAERIRADIAEHAFTWEGATFSLTVSIGVAIFPHDANDWASLLERADEYLYQAKQDGRNLVCPAPGGDCISVAS